MDSITQMFESYVKSAYPVGILSDGQLREVRRAFYAGAHGVFSWIGDPGGDEDENYWKRELEAFKNDVLAGKK